MHSFQFFDLLRNCIYIAVIVVSQMFTAPMNAPSWKECTVWRECLVGLLFGEMLN